METNPLPGNIQFTTYGVEMTDIYLINGNPLHLAQRISIHLGVGGKKHALAGAS